MVVVWTVGVRTRGGCVLARKWICEVGVVVLSGFGSGGVVVMNSEVWPECF